MGRGVLYPDSTVASEGLLGVEAAESGERSLVGCTAGVYCLVLRWAPRYRSKLSVVVRTCKGRLDARAAV